MIRKEIKPDNTFGGNYSYELEYPTLPDKYVEITEEQRDIMDANLDKFRYDENQDGIFENPKGIVDISQTQEYLAQETAKILQQTKEEKLSQNAANYNERLHSGVIYNGNKFDCDDRACIRINGQYLKNLKMPADSIEWFDFDYNSVILTLDDFEELVDTVIAINRAIEVKNCETNLALKEAKTIDELEQINLDYSLI